MAISRNPLAAGPFLRAEITSLGRANANSMASGPIGGGQRFANLFGSEDEFLQRYASFQQDYIKALQTGLDPVRAAGVDVEFLRAGGKIDLSVLSKPLRKQFEARYRDDVLRLPTLFGAMGLPNVELPSANLYRRAFRYEVDTSRTGSALHPMLVAMNRIIFNIDEKKAGLEAFNIGSSNLMSLSQLKQVSSTDLGTLLDPSKTIRTLDVETTSVFKGAQVRQFASVDFHNGVIGNAVTVDYASSQMAGLNVYGRNSATKTMNEFLMGKARGLKISDPSQFLDESAKMLNHLLDADIVAGHNIFFDLNMMASTMKDMNGFSRHKEANRALDRLYEAMSKEGRIVDTLEYTRTYMNNEINQQLSGVTNVTEEVRLQKFKELMYSDEFLARIRAGGSAPYASMEAVSLNTNLLNLLYDDAQKGDKFAQNLFERIFQGSHVADTDSALQTYMMKVMTTDVDPTDPSKGKMLKVTTRSQNRAKQVEIAQNAIARASAITITTNVQDIDDISQTTLNYIMGTQEGRKGVVLNLEQGVLDQESGILRYLQGEGYVFSSAGNTINVTESEAERVIRETLTNAGRTQEDLGYGGRSIETTNLYGRRIAQLPVSYLQESQIGEMAAIRQALANAGQSAALTKSSILENLGVTYRTFGSGYNISDMFNIAFGRTATGIPFSAGLQNYGLGPSATATDLTNAAARYALSTNAMGNAYSFLDARSMVYSTMMAESTASSAQAARTSAQRRVTELQGQLDETTDTAARAQIEGKIAKYQEQLTSLRYADYGDILPEYGVSHFKAQKDFRLIKGLTGSEPEAFNRMFIPTQLLNDVASDVLQTENGLRAGNLSMSFAQMPDGTNRVNLFWKLNKDIDKTKQREIISGIYDHIMNTVNPMTEADKALEANIQMANAHTQLSLIGDRGKAIDFLEKAYEEGGFGVGYAEGPEANKIISGAQKLHVNATNDVLMEGMQATFYDVVGDDYIRTGAFADQKTLEISGNVKNMRDATTQAVESMGTVSDIISGEGIESEARAAFRRSQLGVKGGTLVNFFIKNKTNIRNVGIGLLAAGVGYYAYRNYKENQFYDETTQQQSYEYGSYQPQAFPDVKMELNSYRRDPLVTAGVVGNLDRNKIGHTNMGPNKYNHLFGN